MSLTTSTRGTSNRRRHLASPPLTRRLGLLVGAALTAVLLPTGASASDYEYTQIWEPGVYSTHLVGANSNTHVESIQPDTTLPECAPTSPRTAKFSLFYCDESRLNSDIRVSFLDSGGAVRFATLYQPGNANGPALALYHEELQALVADSSDPAMIRVEVAQWRDGSNSSAPPDDFCAVEFDPSASQTINLRVTSAGATYGSSFACLPANPSSPLTNLSFNKEAAQ